MRTTRRKAPAATAGGGLSGRHYRLAIAILVLAFLCIAAIRWCGQPPIGTDGDEHLIVARTFVRTGHFSVADIHSTKYPPLVSSLAILFHHLRFNVPLSMVVFNYLVVLAASLALLSLILQNNRIGLLSVLPVIYLMSNTVLWASATEIVADALFVLLATLALLLALKVEKWTLRMTALASVLAFLAAMSRSAGLVVIFPLAAAIILDGRRREARFPYGRLALLAVFPVAALALYMIYEARFGPHCTGYLETFLLKDPYDASKGSLTLLSFLARTIRGAVDSLRDVRDLTVYPSFAGILSFALPAALLIFALGRDRKRIVVLSSFVVPCVAVALLWPYKGARFFLPVLPVAALGVGGALASSLQSRNRVVGAVVVLLVLAHIGVNAVNLRTQARDQEGARAFLNSRFEALTEWCKGHIPADEKMASFDYREVMLRLDRPVVPLCYSSDTKTQLAQLARGDIKWLILCWHVYPLRGTYAKSIVDALGDRAHQEYKNDSCEVYRIDVTQRSSAADRVAASKPVSGGL